MHSEHSVELHKLDAYVGSVQHPSIAQRSNLYRFEEVGSAMQLRSMAVEDRSHAETFKV